MQKIYILKAIGSHSETHPSEKMTRKQKKKFPLK